MVERFKQLAAPLCIALLLLVVLRSRPLAALSIALEPIVTGGLDKPVYLTHAGDGSGRLFVVELEGRIRVIRDGQLLARPFLDIRSQVVCCQEQGLFSVAFDPDYEANGAFYANYTDRDGDTAIVRYQVADPSADVARLAAVSRVLTIEQPYFNHNGGQLQFGPRDGFLYVGMGDGGGPGDPHDFGQNADSLLGKMLRLDVRSSPTYAIPASNPFVGQPGYRPEIWALGLRNPWRFSFDRLTGELYIGDVGALCFEEIDFEPASSPGGRNYGWRRMEGFHAFNRQEAGLCNQPRITPAGLTLPVFEYAHEPGNAVTGGYVYRGRAYPALEGLYFFGDFGSGRLWILRQARPGRWESQEALDTGSLISSFGEDESGELYLVDFGAGSIFRITSAALSH